MGQDLFYPPNVGGWPGGRGWLEPRALVRAPTSPQPWSAGEFRAASEPFDADGTRRESRAEVMTATARFGFLEAGSARGIERIGHEIGDSNARDNCWRRQKLSRFDKKPSLLKVAHMISRRDWLRRSTLVSLAPTVPGFLARTARASLPRGDSRILVLIQLDGGNDGINTVVSYKDDGYKKNRRDLCLPTDRLVNLDATCGVGLNPAMEPMAKLFEDGHLAIVQGVGYPNPSRSHFESMAVWQSARSTGEDRDGYGWLGRGLDAAPRSRSGAPGAILLARSDLPLAVRGRRSIAAAMTRPDDFTLANGADPRGDALGSNNSLTTFIRRSATRCVCLRGSNGRHDEGAANEHQLPQDGAGRTSHSRGTTHSSGTGHAGVLRHPTRLRHTQRSDWAARRAAR